MTQFLRDEEKRISTIKGVASGFHTDFIPSFSPGDETVSVFNQSTDRFEVKKLPYGLVTDNEGNSFSSAVEAYNYLVFVFSDAAAVEYVCDVFDNALFDGCSPIFDHDKKTWQVELLEECG